MQRFKEKYMDILNNPWFVSIVGGVISSVIGTIIMSAREWQGSFNAEGCLMGIFKILVYGLLMTIETWACLLLYRALAGHYMPGRSPFPSPVAEIIHPSVRTILSSYGCV